MSTNNIILDPIAQQMSIALKNMLNSNTVRQGGGYEQPYDCTSVAYSELIPEDNDTCLKEYNHPPPSKACDELSVLKSHKLIHKCSDRTSEGLCYQNTDASDNTIITGTSCDKFCDSLSGFQKVESQMCDSCYCMRKEATTVGTPLPKSPKSSNSQKSSKKTKKRNRSSKSPSHMAKIHVSDNKNKKDVFFRRWMLLMFTVILMIVVFTITK